MPSERSYDSESDLDLELTYLEEMEMKQEIEKETLADIVEEEKEPPGVGDNFLDDLINANFDDVDLDEEDKKKKKEPSDDTDMI